uniref:Uncharacterized protein n=1 Tax=Phlebotomus papatasi TaxID=29031 RepID=A0A1B0DB29_PHLPP
MPVMAVETVEWTLGFFVTQEPNAQIDDSWFWEPDNNTSSSSSKNEEILSKSPSGGDLTIIPLDQSSDTDSQERYHRKLDETETKLKKANLENALLMEKVKQLTGENRDLNENIEELDKQHSVIVENLLAQKNQLQEQLTEVKASGDNLARMKKELADLAGKHEKVESAYVQSVQENVSTKTQMEAINSELRRAVCENVELVAAIEVKNEELKNLLAEKEKLQHEFQDFFVKMKGERDNEATTVKQLTDKINFLEQDVQKSSSYSMEIKQKVVELSEQLEREQLEKQELQQEFLAFQESVREFKKNSTDAQKLEDQEYQEMKRKFPIIEEELKIARETIGEFQSKCQAIEIENKQLNEDYVALQEDDLILQRNFHALEEKLAESERICTEVKQKYEQVAIERKQIEEDFVALQEEDLDLQRDFHNLKEKYSEFERIGQEAEAGKSRIQALEAAEGHNLTLQKEFQDLKERLLESERICQEMSQKYEQAAIEKRQIEEDFAALQEEDLDLQRNFHALKEKFAESERIFQEEKGKFQTLQAAGGHNLTSQKDFQALQEKLLESERICKEVTQKYEQVSIEKRQIEQDFIALQEDDLNLQREFHSFREQQTSGNGNFTQLSEENNNLQRQIIDLQSKINSCIVEDVGDVKIPSSRILELLKNYGNFTSHTDDGLRSLEDFLKATQDTKYKLEAVEKRLAEAYSGINQHKEEMRKLEHEKKTIQADLMHYEIECSELMKNNEVLVQELDEIKSGKLETIQENSEETVAMLEKQLEECNAINQSLESDCQALNNRLDQMESERDEIQQKISNLEMEIGQKSGKINELRDLVNSLENEKSNLQFELTELKVADSGIEKYHKEITDLQAQLAQFQEAHEKDKIQMEELTKEKNELINFVTVKHNESVQYHTEIQRLNQLLQQEMTKNATCTKCPEFQQMLQKNQEALKRMVQLEKLPDKIDFLQEKANLLEKTLLTEQQSVKVLAKEKQELIEEKGNLTRDLQRLQQHLLSVEEDHTTQMVELQHQAEEYKNKLTLLEQEAQKSSNAYTSASIRANQHAETLQAQYMLLSQQRDELSAKLSAAEDRESKNQAALINLQCALEQFQRDKDRDVEATTFRVRKQLEDERKAHEDALNEVRSLQNQLSEAKTGLLAASRISDQLEMSQTNLSAQREEMQKLQEKCSKLEQKIHESETNQADKVEKTLIKNLVIGDETQGLAQAFVKFLEKESQPRQPPTSASLLNISHSGGSSKKPPTPASKSPEPTSTTPQPPVQPILLSDNILQALSPPRNSSTILKDILNDT